MHTITADFFGSSVRAQTEGNMVCLTDLILAANVWRSQRGLPTKELRQVTTANVGFREFLVAAVEEYGIQESDIYQVIGKGRYARTMAHVSIAVYVAEQMSPAFHVKVIREFAEGRLLEYRALGSTEFKELNVAIDTHLPDRLGRNNRGCFIETAKRIRAKILGTGDTDWSTATANQTHARFDIERRLVSALQLGLVSTWEQFKAVVDKA